MKGTEGNVFAWLNLRRRIAWTYSKGQFYTYRLPNKTLWFQRIRQRMGFAERCGTHGGANDLCGDNALSGKPTCNSTSQISSDAAAQSRGSANCPAARTPQAGSAG